MDGGDAAGGPEARGPLQEQEFHLVLQLRVQLLEGVIVEIGEAGRGGGVQAGGRQGAPAGREGPRTAARGQALHAAGEAGAGGERRTLRGWAAWELPWKALRIPLMGSRADQAPPLH